MTRVDLLLILRGLAALAVVLWHAEGHKAEWPAVVNLPGRTAVWLFFGISGYVIAYGFVHRRYALTGEGLRAFYVNRLLRIYPLFLALSAFGFAAHLVTTGEAPIGLREVPTEILALQFNHDYVLNGVFWTLGVEIQFYLAAPVLALVLFVPRRHPELRIAIAYGLALAATFAGPLLLGWSWDGRNLISNLPQFMTGMIACWWVARAPVAGRYFWPAIIGMCVVLALSNLSYHLAPGLYWRGAGLVAANTAVALLVVAHSALTSRGVMQTRVTLAFSWLGVLSYG